MTPEQAAYIVQLLEQVDTMQRMTLWTIFFLWAMVGALLLFGRKE